MQFFQCGIPSRGALRYPLAIECSPRIPVPDAIECEEESRDYATVSAFYSTTQDEQQDHIQNDSSKLNTTKTFDSLDQFLSPFEEDMALHRTAMYAQHDADVDAKVREIMDFRNQAASIKTSVEKTAERFGKSATRSARKTRKQQDASRIVEDLEALSPRMESPHIRIFCKLQQSERFKVFCFPRNGKSLVQLLRGVEDKLMLGVKADRPGRLMLVVNNRASIAEDFVEIDDFASIRDEDRFIFLPYLAEERCSSHEEYEKLDLNYSTSEGASPPKQARKMFIDKVPHNSVAYGANSAQFSRHPDYYRSEIRLPPTKNPKMRKEFEWLQDQNMTGRTSTMSTVTSSTRGIDDTLYSEPTGEDNRETMSPTTTPFNWSLDENEWDEGYQQDEDFPYHGNDNLLKSYLPTGEGTNEGEMREGPPEDTCHVLSPAEYPQAYRGLDAIRLARDLKKNRFAMEAKTKEFTMANGPSGSRGSHGDRYCQMASDDVESDGDPFMEYNDLNKMKGYDEPFDGFPSSVDFDSPYETSRSRSLRRSEEVEHRRRCPPPSPSRGNNRGQGNRKGEE